MYFLLVNLLQEKKQKITCDINSTFVYIYKLSVVGVLYVISRENICCWLINHFFVMATKATQFSEITHNSGHYAVQGHSRSPTRVGIVR